MEVPNGELITMDAQEFLRQQPSKTVQLVIGSPPYEDVRTYSIGFDKQGHRWVDWMVSIYLESLRVCDGLVAFVVEGKTRKFSWSATPALLMAELVKAGVTLRKPPIYHRFGIPGSGGPDFLRNDYEFIVCATNGGKLPWSDNTAMGHPPKWAPGGEMSHRLSDGTRRNQWGASAKSGGARQKNGNRQELHRPSHEMSTMRSVSNRKENGKREDYIYREPAKANPGNTIQERYTVDQVAELIGDSPDVIHCKVGGNQMGSKFAHENEAPFPETLAEFLIKSFCPPGGIVLDPFSGSGTSCAVAAKNGRRFIGVDVRESQTALARERILTEVENVVLA